MTADEQTIESLQQQLREAQESSRQMLLWAQGAEAREGALAAHVERLGGVLFDTFAAIEDGDISAIPYDAYRDLRNDEPTTSLARRDAEKQAEVMEEVKRNLPGGRGAAWQLLSKRINELRRQVEGGE